MKWLLILCCLFSFAKEAPLRIQIGGEPSTLDPARALDQYAFGILHNVTLGLTTTDAQGHIQMGLAQKFSVSSDGRFYRFTLRKNAKWSDGKPLTAQHIVLGLRQALSPKTGAPNADLFFDILNAEEIFHGKKPPESLGVEALGSEVQIQLKRPNPILLMVLSLPVASPSREDFSEPWDFRRPVTGDYVISGYSPADHIDLQPNPYRAPPAQQAVTYKVLSEEIAALNLFESGYFDIISTMTATEVDRFRSLDLVQTAPSTTVFFVSFNLKKPPFDQLKWRQAVASVLDRAGMAGALKGLYEPTTSFIPPSIAGYKAFSPLPVSGATLHVKQQTAKPRVRLAYGASAFTRVVAEKIQGDLKAKLNLDLQLEPMELKTLLARLKTDPPEMYILGLSALYDDALNHLGSFAFDRIPNFSRYDNPAYAHLLEKLRIAPIGEKRAQAALAAQKRLVQEDVVLVPLLLRLQVLGVGKNLNGFQINPFQMIELKALSRK